MHTLQYIPDYKRWKARCGATQVAIVDGDRLLGEEAAALAVRYPDRVYARHAQPRFITIALHPHSDATYAC